MSDAGSTYWSAILQILPVFGLAIVLEARTLAQSWQKHGGLTRPERRFQMLLLTVAGTGVAVSTLIAVSALREDQEPGEWSSWLVRMGVAAAVGGTLGSPMLTILVHSESKILTRIVRWPEARQLRKLQRSLERNHLHMVRARRGLFEQFVESQTFVDDIRARRDANPQDSARWQRLEALHVQGQEVQERVRTSWRNAINVEQAGRMLNREMRRIIGEVIQERHSSLATALQRAADPIGGLSGGIEDTLHLATPDDGGFLSPEPFDLPDIEMELGMPFITDAADLYVSRGHRSGPSL